MLPWKPIAWITLLAASIAAGAWLTWLQELAPQLQGVESPTLQDALALWGGEIFGHVLSQGLAFFALSALAGALIGAPFAVIGYLGAVAPLAGWAALAVFTYLAHTGAS